MNDAILEEVRAWFAGYAAEHLRRGRLPAMMRLKLEHSRRVAEEARGIATELGWSREDQNTAEALGWLHDAGRFSQLEQFGTFRDRDSVNHAVRGHEVVSHAGILRSSPPMRQRQILEGILYHNALYIPDGCDDESLAFIRLIRDADKLDIYGIFLDAMRDDRLNENPEIVHDVDINGPITRSLLEVILHGRVPAYGTIRSLNDWKLVQLSWVYEIHYQPTLRRLLDRRILEDLAAGLPNTAGVGEVVAKTMAFARLQAAGDSCRVPDQGS
jgi:hypothetical protein